MKRVPRSPGFEAKHRDDSLAYIFLGSPPLSNFLEITRRKASRGVASADPEVDEVFRLIYCSPHKSRHCLDKQRSLPRKHFLSILDAVESG